MDVVHFALIIACCCLVALFFWLDFRVSRLEKCLLEAAERLGDLEDE